MAVSDFFSQNSGDLFSLGVNALGSLRSQDALRNLQGFAENAANPIGVNLPSASANFSGGTLNTTLDPALQGIRDPLFGVASSRANELGRFDQASREQETLGLLRRRAHEDENRQGNTLLNKLFSTGRLAGPGGAQILGDQSLALQNADLDRQLAARGEARTQADFLLNQSRQSLEGGLFAERPAIQAAELAISGGRNRAITAGLAAGLGLTREEQINSLFDGIANNESIIDGINDLFGNGGSSASSGVLGDPAFDAGSSGIDPFGGVGGAAGTTGGGLAATTGTPTLASTAAGSGSLSGPSAGALLGGGGAAAGAGSLGAAAAPGLASSGSIAAGGGGALAATPAAATTASGATAGFSTAGGVTGAGAGGASAGAGGGSAAAAGGTTAGAAVAALPLVVAYLGSQSVRGSEVAQDNAMRNFFEGGQVQLNLNERASPFANIEGNSPTGVSFIDPRTGEERWMDPQWAQIAVGSSFSGSMIPLQDGGMYDTQSMQYFTPEEVIAINRSLQLQSDQLGRPNNVQERLARAGSGQGDLFGAPALRPGSNIGSFQIGDSTFTPAPLFQDNSP